MAISLHDLLRACLALAALRRPGLDDAVHGHQDRAAKPASTNIGEDALHIHIAAPGTCGTHYGLQDCAAEAADADACDRVANRAQALLFHGGSGDISADCAADCFHT